MFIFSDLSVPLFSTQILYHIFDEICNTFFSIPAFYPFEGISERIFLVNEALFDGFSGPMSEKRPL